MKLLEDIKSNNALIAIERPLDEPIRGEKQLRHPSIAGPERKQFLVEYQKSHDYELAANIAFRGIVRRRKLKIEKIKMQVKKTIKIFVPRKLWLSLDVLQKLMERVTNSDIYIALSVFSVPF